MPPIHCSWHMLGVFDAAVYFFLYFRHTGDNDAVHEHSLQGPLCLMAENPGESWESGLFPRMALA